MTHEIFSHDDDNSPFADIKKLSDALSDPFTQEIIKGAKEKWQTSDVENLDEFELAQLLDELDEEFPIYLHMPVKVTGPVEPIDENMFVGPGIYEKNSNEESFFEENGEFFSGGYIAEYDQDFYSLKLLLVSVDVDSEDTVVDLNDSNAKLYTTSIDSIISSDNLFSETRAHAVLETYLPNLTNEVDQRILNADNFCDAILNLKELDLSDLTKISSENKEIYQLARNSFIYYLNNTLSLDQQMPCVMDYKGYMLFDNDTKAGNLEANQAGVSVYQLLPYELPQDDLDADNSIYSILGISAVVRGKDPEGDLPVTLLVDKVEDISSLRDFLYS